MDNCLPQMESFDFKALHKFDPIAFEQTLAFLNRPVSPQPGDDASFSYQDMLYDAVHEMDWMGSEPLDMPLAMEMEMEMEPAVMQERDGASQSSHMKALDKNMTGFLPVTAPPTVCSGVINQVSRENGNEQSCVQDVTRGSDGQMTPFMLTGIDRDAASPNNKQPLFAYHLQECSWDSCDEANPSRGHLGIHAITARTKWIPNSKCTWEGCQSKALFANLTKYNHHLMNIHTEPLVCTSRGCSYKKPFRNQHDLCRHQITAHATSTKVFECPYPDCEQQSKTFIRKDKWLQHIREVQHLNDAFCPYFHCSLVDEENLGGFKDREAIIQHFSRVHSAFQGEGMQCGLASCGEGIRDDFWNRPGLEEHLELQHGLESTWDIIESAGKAGRRIVLVEDISDTICYFWSKSQVEWHDCSICSQQDQPEKFTTERKNPIILDL